VSRLPDPLGPVEAVDPISAAPVDVVDLIAEAAEACPAVAWLHGGRFSEHTTYLPGRRVRGVTLSCEEIVVGVVGSYPASVAEIAAQVRAAVGAVVLGVPVTVNVEDLLLPGQQMPGDNLDPVAVDPAGSAPGRPAFAQAGPVLPEPLPAPVQGTWPIAPSGTRAGGSPTTARPPSATLLAPPEKGCSS
jgi:hypothetical protein